VTSGSRIFAEYSHPTIKVLALSFLLMIGMVLIAEGFDIEVPKNYVYFAMGFAVFVELMNMRLRKVAQPAVVLHEPYVERRSRSPH
jgi:predicted tellurium resistance membrane protein TerC